MRLQNIPARVLRELKHRPLIYALIGVVVIAVGVFAATLGPDEQPASAYYAVQRSDFLVSIVEGGTLEAVNEVSIRSEVDGTARVIKIVPEGSYVKKGDLLVELDSANVEDQVNQQEITVEKNQFTLIQAEKNLAIQQSIIDSEVNAAALKEEFADTDLKKYLEGEYPQSRLKLGIEITNAMEQLELAKDRLQWSIKLADEGFETKSKVDQDRLSYNQLEAKLREAQENMRLLEAFDHPKSLRQFQASLDEAKLDLERVKQQGTNKMAQYTADVDTQRKTLELSQQKLEKLKEQFKATKIYAPQDGLVVYPMGSRFSNESMIEEGATVRNRQELIKLPDVSLMKVTIKVHESHINQVSVGQTAYVVLDSMPDKRFKAVVKKVGLLPDNQSRWGNPNLKVYATEIVIQEPLPDIKPGLSAQAEIVVTNMKDVLTVPIQAVSTYKGQTVCFVDNGGGPAPVPVDVGLYNTKYIQIASGLSEGDRILLSAPPNFDVKDLDGSLIGEEEKADLARNGNGSPAPGAVPPTAGTAQSMNGSGNPGPNAEAAVAARPAEDADFGRGRGGRGPASSAPRGDSIKQWDKNGDGELDDDERAAMRTARGGRNGAGGGLMSQNLAEMMKQFDKNGDGQLDESEREAARTAMRERFGGARRPGSGGGDPTPRTD